LQFRLSLPDCIACAVSCSRHFFLGLAGKLQIFLSNLIRNYFTYYNGSSGVNRQFPIAGQIDLNVDATSYADSLGAFWVTPLKIFGAYYAPGVALPLVWTDVTAQVTLPGGGTASRSESVSGLGDMEFWPVALSWSALSGDLHVDFLNNSDNSNEICWNGKCLSRVENSC
jgi:hypothetical protein